MILRRIEGERFSEVLPEWDGRTVVILGGGPSLTKEQFFRVGIARKEDRIRVIAVNDSYLLAPWADVAYAADSHWHRWHTEGIEKASLGLGAEAVREAWASFAGEKCTIQNSGANVTDDRVHMMRNKHHPNRGNGLSLDPRCIVTGWNSGFQALNLAVLAGAKRILLLGFDGKPGENGRGHWHDEHPRPTPDAAYPLYRQAMSSAENTLAELGVEVFNCSPGSAIDSFPKRALEDAL